MGTDVETKSPEERLKGLPPLFSHPYNSRSSRRAPVLWGGGCLLLMRFLFRELSAFTMQPSP